jgi:two-component system, sensor histidine kinase
MTTESDHTIKPRILVAEDNDLNIRVIKAMLTKLGYAVDVLQDGEEVVAAIKDGMRPALILMDLQMPVMNGIEATQLIRLWETQTQHPRIPIVALTAAVYGEDVSASLEAGMDDFLMKPLSVAALTPVLEKWCSAG